MNLSTSLRGVPSREEMSHVCHLVPHIFRFVCIDIEAYACGCSFKTMQCVSAWLGVFASIAKSSA